MTKARLLGIVALVAVLTALFVVLLWQGEIGSTAFVALMTVLALVSLALHFGHRVIEVDFGKSRLLLAEIKTVQDDVHAKVETVKRLGEELAELTYFAAVRVGRFATDSLQKDMLVVRDRITNVLQEVGADKDRAKQISDHIEGLVEKDLKRNIRMALQHHLHELSMAKQIFDKEVIEQEAQPLLADYDRDKLVEYLRARGVYTTELEPKLNALDQFLAKREL